MVSSIIVDPMRRVPVSLIAACALNRAIGRNGTLPWHLPADWAFFATATRAQVLILGRRSFQETNEPLMNRHTIVVSPSLAKTNPITVSYINASTSIAIVPSLKEALMLAMTDATYVNVRRVFVGGGERLFEEALTRGVVDSCYVTRVHQTLEDGDAFLPTWTTYCPHLTFVRSTITQGTRISMTIWSKKR